MAKKKQNRYEKAIEDIQKEKENYLLSQFEDCHPQAKELSKTQHQRKIAQDHRRQKPI